MNAPVQGLQDPARVLVTGASSGIGLAMVQALIGQMLYADPVVYDWAHIQVPASSTMCGSKATTKSDVARAATRAST